MLALDDSLSRRLPYLPPLAASGGFITSLLESVGTRQHLFLWIHTAHGCGALA